MEKQIEKKTALYCRVSTGHQATGLEAQIRAIRNYCHHNGITNYLMYTDENQSGVKHSRPALDKMMASVRAGEVDRVIVYSFSRFARSVTHLLRALEEFKSFGVAFISVTEAIDTKSPLGQALFVILSAISQLERDILIERVKNGLANAKAKGIHIGRKKVRPSEMIRKLYLSAVPYSEISRITGMSQGAVGAEALVIKNELGADKVKEIRQGARRRLVVAYKPMMEFPPPLKNNEESKPSATESFSEPVEVQAA